MLSTMEINIRLLNLLKEQLPEALHPPTHAQTMHWSFNGIMEMTTAKKAKGITLCMVFGLS